jgi:hypothetical protein
MFEQDIFHDLTLPPFFNEPNMNCYLKKLEIGDRKSRLPRGRKFANAYSFTYTKLPIFKSREKFGLFCGWFMQKRKKAFSQ